MRGDNAAKKTSKPYSLKYDGKYWQANIKKPDGSWGTKSVPAALGYGLGQEILAEAWIVNYLDNLYSGKNAVVAAKTTIAMLLNRWLEYRKNLHTTQLTTYQNLVSAALHVIDSNIYHLDIVSEINVKEAKAFYDALPVAVSSKKAVIGHLGGMLRDFAINEWIPEDYVSVFKRPGFIAHVASAKAGAPKPVIKTASHTLIKDLISHNMPHYRLLFAIGYYAGLRRNEIQGLSWEDIDFTNKVLHVRKQLLQPGPAPYVHSRGMRKEEIVLSKVAVMSPPKYGSERELPIHPRLLGMLELAFAARAPSPGEPVCPSSNNCYGRSLRALAELTRAGISMHALRRTMATDLGRAGVPDERIGVILGHGAGKTVRKHYVKSEVESYRADINSLPSL